MTAVRVIFHRLAEADYRRARFMQAVADATARIAANPGVGSPIFVDYRWVKVKRFRFLLYYRQLSPDLVVVYAVAHSGRRPGYWLRRARGP